MAYLLRTYNMFFTLLFYKNEHRIILHININMFYFNAFPSFELKRTSAKLTRV